MADDDNAPQQAEPADGEQAAKKPAAKAAKAAAAKPAKAKAEQAKPAKAKAEAAKAEAKTDAKTAAGTGETQAKAAAGKAPAKAAKAKAADKAKAKAVEPASEPEQPRAESKPAKAQAGVPTRRVVQAHARYVRTSARKARIVCPHIRGKSVVQARAILAFTPRDVARDWSKLLESAVANAENNHELLEDELVVREAYADEGPTIKRFRPRAMGRATPIRKRTSHLTITLTAAP
jgi:ribosomal protein L22